MFYPMTFGRSVGHRHSGGRGPDRAQIGKKERERLLFLLLLSVWMPVALCFNLLCVFSLSLLLPCSAAPRLVIIRRTKGEEEVGVAGERIKKKLSLFSSDFAYGTRQTWKRPK